MAVYLKNYSCTVSLCFFLMKFKLKVQKRAGTVKLALPVKLNISKEERVFWGELSFPKITTYKFPQKSDDWVYTIFVDFLLKNLTDYPKVGITEIYAVAFLKKKTIRQVLCSSFWYLYLSQFFSQVFVVAFFEEKFLSRIIVCIFVSLYISLCIYDFACVRKMLIRQGSNNCRLCKAETVCSDFFEAFECSMRWEFL